MNLADMLSYADIHQLGRIATHYRCECSTHSKNELIQTILTKMNRKEVFEHNVLSLGVEDVRFLNWLLFDQRNAFSLEELLARASQSRFDKEKDERFNPRETISKFREHGWLFNGHSHQTKYLFQIPTDLKKRFEDALAKHYVQGLAVMHEPPAVYRDEQGLLAEDHYHFLRVLYDQDVDLTMDGAMYKRSQQMILDRFSVREELIGKVGYRFGYGRRFKEYPNRFSFLYDYCFYNGYIREEPGRLTLTELGRQFVEEDRRENVLALYRFWLRLYKGPVPNIVSLVHWMDRLCLDWTTFESLRAIMGPLIKPFYYDGPDAILEQRIVGMMLHLGLVRVGQDESQGLVVQTTKLGSSVISGVYVADEERIVIPVDSR